MQNKLKSLYEKGKKEAAIEIDMVKKALDNVYQIRNIRHELRIQVRFAGTLTVVEIFCIIARIVTTFFKKIFI